MPITYEIDSSRRIVFVRAFGNMKPQDFFAYQKEAWSGQALRGYDECVDMTEVTGIEGATGKNMEKLAALAAAGDDPAQATRLAIIASLDLHFGLARMYETYRGQQPHSSRKVGIFRTRDEALRWLAGQGTGS